MILPDETWRSLLFTFVYQNGKERMAQSHWGCAVVTTQECDWPI
jgi:hypothetical protein